MRTIALEPLIRHFVTPSPYERREYYGKAVPQSPSPMGRGSRQGGEGFQAYQFEGQQ